MARARVTAPDTPIPFSPPLKEAFLPNAAKVADKARCLLVYWASPYARLSGMFRAALWIIFQRRLRSRSVTSLVSFW